MSMGVYIDMEMPTSCDDCGFFEPYQESIGYCGISNSQIPCDCPLVPVPPHGRLIDADALKSDDEYFIGKMMMFGGEEIYSQSTIDRAPTIIPASKEGEE